eukprot:TRINITY_DN21106_c0_g4_i1.p1 TRINITY_DN21106_c0_g4~~TRINITY_DN21106_c0_g4_i1.p1  ORF type:complete len:497 (-),score=84.81 TRINITY_DN21106_c0_g4_i1:52-1542(-)
MWRGAFGWQRALGGTSVIASAFTASQSRRNEIKCEAAPPISPLTAVSAIDGRYASRTAPLRIHLSEYALHKNRAEVMVKWVLHMADNPALNEVKELSPGAIQQMLSIVDAFDVAAAEKVKKIERTTNHDLKAVEYHIKSEMDKSAELVPLKEWVHFACTSEDVNNNAYALMLSKARSEVLLPKMDQVISELRALAKQHAAQPMHALTHGQSATPTTFGKEMANFAFRLQKHRDAVAAVEIVGKFNGATGNFNAHKIAYPDVDWPSVSNDFVNSLGLSYQPYSTQIECHDFIAELCDAVGRFNVCLLDCDRDMWSYTSRGILKLKTVKGEVGSSTMPHKVNPIDFENSEGNVGLANALLHHFAEKLPVSRMQRDLSDSTVLRGLGTAFGYSLIAYESTLKALSRITVNADAMSAELDASWEVLGEAAQTLLRKHQVPGAYELLKDLTRGQTMDAATMRSFFASLKDKIPPEDLLRLQNLTPATYVGCAEDLARAQGR